MAPDPAAEALLGVCHITVRTEGNNSQITRIMDNQEAIHEACHSDLGKGRFETYLTEIGWCANDCIFVSNNLEKWAKEESAENVPLMNMALSPKIRKDPLGCVLIIG